MAETMESRNVMSNVKDWLQNKCRDTSLLQSVDKPPVHPGHQLTYSKLAITHDNVPKFIIPSFMEPAQNGSKSLFDTDLQSQSSSGGSMTSASGLPGSYAGPLHVWDQQPALMSAICVPALPRSPYESSSSGSNSSHTNSDPMSLAALTLPHLKKQTLYGFETLTEMPRTCRRESLFHDGRSTEERSQGLPLTSRTSKRDNSSSQQTSIPQIRIEDVDRGTSCRRYHKRQHNRTVVIAPLGNILPKKLPVPSLQSSSCQGCREDNIRELGYSPRCGSRATDNCCTCPDNKTNGTKHSQHSISSSERQQHQHQDNLQRASLKGVNLHCRNCLLSSSSLLQINQGNPNMLKRPSSGSASSGYGSCSSCQSVLQSSEGVSSSSSSSSSSSKGQHIGQVRLNLLYLPEQQQLKVGLIQVKNLTSSNTEIPSNNRLKNSPTNSPPTEKKAQQLNHFVKLCLMPGKVQRHVSKVVRHMQNPVFNQNFIFNHLERNEVAKKSLRLKVYHKKAKLGREELLGELTVSMAELIPSTEVTLLRELEPVGSRHKLGYIHISVCFYPSTEKLMVGVHQVTDLTRQRFTGAPDPYVRVELSQLRRSSTRQQTKTRKNTDHVFNETFIFGISPKLDDLHYSCLTVTVLDHSTLLADKEIGQVCLGLDATEEAEFHHWNQALQFPGHPATSWHVLMHPYSS